jgi:hypothetical protein
MSRDEFDDLGEEEVRKRLRVWDASKQRRARQWLEFKEWSKSSSDAQQTLKVASEANDLARSGNKIAAGALILAVIAIAVSFAGLILKR